MTHTDTDTDTDRGSEAGTDSAAHTAYGVTKPVGYVLVAFPSVQDAHGAMVALKSAGFADEALRFYSPGQMLERAEAELAHPTILATIGQELNLVRAQRDLAATGHAFVAVHAPRDGQARRVADIVRAHGARRAQKYGRLIIEELIEPGTGERQVAESPDRGLDPQTASGEEGGA